MPLEDKINLFNEETFLITSETNKPRLQRLKNVIFTVLASTISSNFNGFQFLNKEFPLHHENPNKETSTIPTDTHVEKPFYLKETATLDMVKILNKIVERYLEILAEMMGDDKEKFLEMVTLARDKDTPMDIRKDAEDFIKKASREQGELIIHGDQLTVDRIESAR